MEHDQDATRRPRCRVSGRSWRPVRIRVCQGHGRNRSCIRGPPVDPQAHGREAREGVVRRGRVKTLGGSRRTVNWRSPEHRPQPKTKSCHPPREPIDTSTAAGKCFLGMPGVFAEFETTLRRERQLEGIAKAKAAGIYKGRKPMVSADAIKALRAEGKGPHGDRKGPGHLEDECISSASAGRAEGQVGAF